jgi:hypothetical protein
VLAIAVDAGYVYLATSAETKRLPLSGGQPTPFASAGGSGGARVVGQLLYLAGGGGLGRVPLAGGALTILDAKPVAAFVVDATHAHYSELGSDTHIWQIALETNQVAPIVELGTSGGIVADAAQLYYFGPKLMKLAKTGGAPELVSDSTAESARDWCELVQNDSRLFWAAGSELRSVRKDGSDERVIDSLASTTCIAADESAIYYYSAIKGSVRQLAM